MGLILRAGYLYGNMAALPIFYQEGDFSAGTLLELSEDAARHVVQVLRMNGGDLLELANGKGISASCTITDTGKKRCTVRIEQLTEVAQPTPALHLAISFTKNAARNEWLLEKAAELGVQRISPLITARTERERFRYDRFKGILVSAMMQSQQYWLPVLDEPMPFIEFVEASAGAHRMIAHCMDELSRVPVEAALAKQQDMLLLVGPEGDFTEEEVGLVMRNGGTGISLGNTRLRTETAAIAACALFHLRNA